MYCYLINCLTIGLIANQFRSFRRNAYKILIGFRHGPISQDLSEPSTVKKMHIYMYTAKTDQSTSGVICVNVISSKTQGFKSCAKVMVCTRAGSASDKNQPIIIYLRVKEWFFFFYYNYYYHSNASLGSNVNGGIIITGIIHLTTSPEGFPRVNRAF